MEVPPTSSTFVVGIFRAQELRSTLPRTAVTGAISASLSKISGAPMSPAWMMKADPSRAANASGRSRPWVSEITPICVIFTGYRVGAGVLTCPAERSSAPMPALSRASGILPENSPTLFSSDYPKCKRPSHQASLKRATLDRMTPLATLVQAYQAAPLIRAHARFHNDGAH